MTKADNQKVQDLALELCLANPITQDDVNYKTCMSILNQAKRDKPVLFALAMDEARRDTHFVHGTKPEPGHTIAAAAEEFRGEMAIREVCSCGWRGEVWIRGAGPAAGTVIRAGKAVQAA